MPKTARARVASPPAGTALARAIRGLPPGPRPTGRDSVYVTVNRTNVNYDLRNGDISRRALFKEIKLAISFNYGYIIFQRNYNFLFETG